MLSSPGDSRNVAFNEVLGEPFVVVGMRNRGADNFNLRLRLRLWSASQGRFMERPEAMHKSAGKTGVSAHNIRATGIYVRGKIGTFNGAFAEFTKIWALEKVCARVCQREKEVNRCLHNCIS
nr:hypothetical protein [Tanacetum cinerariifolium]